MSNWIYHPNLAAKIVNDEEYEDHLKNGWFDSPAKCSVQEVVAVVTVEENVPQGTLDIVPTKKKAGRPKLNLKVAEG